MLKYLVVAFGGAIGAVARHGTCSLIHTWFPAAFPWATMTVNLVGSFLIGISAGLAMTVMTGNYARLIIMTGFLGAFTTFSTFSMENIHLIQTKQAGLAGINMVVSCLAGLVLAFVGLYAGKWFGGFLHLRVLGQ